MDYKLNDTEKDHLQPFYDDYLKEDQQEIEELIEVVKSMYQPKKDKDEVE